MPAVATPEELAERRRRNAKKAERYRALYPERRAESQRRWSLRSQYGITPEEYDAMLAEQDGRCRGCWRKPRVKRLAVDHDHVPGFAQMPPEEKRRHVRSLLCDDCNRHILGHAVRRGCDAPATLRRLALTLEGSYRTRVIL